MFYKLVFLLIAVIVCFYTFTFAHWLWREKMTKQAWGVFFLTLFSLIYFLLYVALIPR
ncbi:MAG TPA: hypothetical protein GX687_00180 [Clostridia bacterium]|nr:hypothetical protein [Clostridia bacterium]